MATLETDRYVKHWLDELSAARKREKDFRRDGRDALEIYSGLRKENTPFNILYSNTETLLPALYGQPPRPVVSRRYKDEDPIGKAASQAAERGLEFAIDTNLGDYQTFSEAVGDSVLDALLPGRGIVRVKYDAELTGDVVQKEYVCFEAVDWDRFLHGYARKWTKVPWVSFEHDMDEKEVAKMFGEAIAEKTTFTAGQEMTAGDERKAEEPEEGKTLRKTAKVYEIWDKESKQVLFVSAHCKTELMAVKDDPLELSGFFPIPEPLQFVRKSHSLVPTSPYTLYENQAKELNTLTIRINRLVESLKVRGAYNNFIKEIEQVFKADDNVLIPLEQAAAIENAKGLEAAIWLMPIEKIVAVVQQLYLAREQCKQVIFEITGIADILRGSSKASETLGAQQIKEKWGTLRIKRVQTDVQLFCRELLRMATEVMAGKLQEKTWQQMTGLPYATTEQVQEAKMVTEAAQTSGQQPPPEAVQVLQAPKWAAVIGVLQNDLARAYKVDIETNSTLDPEAMEDQKHIFEVMTAVSQFLQGVTPLIVSGVLPFQAAQSVLLAIVRRYRFGPMIEDQIKQMQPPQTPPGEEGQQGEDPALLDEKKKNAQLELEKHAKGLEDKLREKDFNVQLREAQVSQKEKDLQRDAEGFTKDIKHKEEVFGLREKAARERQQGGAQKGTDVDKEALMAFQQLTKQMETMTQQNMAIAKAIQASGENVKTAFVALTEELMALKDAVEAERESEIVVGADGKKKGVSRRVKPQVTQ